MDPSLLDDSNRGMTPKQLVQVMLDQCKDSHNLAAGDRKVISYSETHEITETGKSNTQPIQLLLTMKETKNVWDVDLKLMNKHKVNKYYYKNFRLVFDMLYPTAVFNSIIPTLAILVGGFIGSAGSDKFWKRESYKSYRSALSPPNWFFGVAWTVVYLLLSAVIYLIQEDVLGDTVVRYQMLVLFILHMPFNFVWTHVFIQNAVCGLVCLLFLVFCTVWMMVIGFLQPTMSYLFISACLLSPCIIWLLFATYLNGIFVFNQWYSPIPDDDWGL